MNLNDVCLKRYIVNNSQPRIMYDTFCSFIFTINGKFYIQEDYQLGEIWSEEEIWGSTLYDLDNMKENNVKGITKEYK